MNAIAGLSAEAAREAGAWTEALAAALAAGRPDAIRPLLLDTIEARDLVALDWTIRTLSGAEATATALAEGAARVGLTNLRLHPTRTAPRHVTRAGVRLIEAFLAFDTKHGQGDAVARLVPTNDGHAAWSLTLTLQTLHARPEIDGRHQARAEEFSRDFGAPNWLDQRTHAHAYADRSPAVLVVGAGQAGLGIAARLTRLGIDTLIVDREARIGDNWRRRYHALTLHNEVHVNDLPFMPFPPSFPTFIPKDKLANWFEAYVDALDLAAWTSTSLTSGTWDEQAGHWTVTLDRPDGPRTLQPRHIVFATGVSSIPLMPALPGQDRFQGSIVHSGDFTDGRAWKGRRALVIGTGNSGHDVAQDLHAGGAHVTMIQRSPTYVVSLREAQSVYAIYNEGIPNADCDLLATAMPYRLLRQAYQLSTAASRQADKPLHDALEARGFRLTFGEDETGFQMMYLRRGGGYYFNVGASDLIATGAIALAQWDDLQTLTEAGAQFTHGHIDADLIVCATGYANQQETARRALGDSIADKIGPVWGFGPDQELRNMWRPTPQPHLWFTAGSLAQCRIFSRYLALQIAAREAGLLAADAG